MNKGAIRKTLFFIFCLFLASTFFITLMLLCSTYEISKIGYTFPTRLSDEAMNRTALRVR